MSKVYIFNPEHDLAMANGGPNFKAPESAVALAEDLSLLPCWYADPGSLIISDLTFKGHNMPFPLDINIVPTFSQQFMPSTKAEPWGWDPAICKFLKQNGVDTHVLPNGQQLAHLKETSHRRMASQAMRLIRERTTLGGRMPQPAVELHSFDEITGFAASHPDVVFKAPWSGSGKGIFFSAGELTASIAGWCRRTLEKQGAVMGEVRYKRVQDFAMEFRAIRGTVRFAGYSLFLTEGTGIYRGNRLMSNSQIEQELSRWIPAGSLLEIQQCLIDFLTAHIEGEYSGYIGVDMFIYRNDDGYGVNPAVEINMRMTMGMVARIIADRYIAPGSTGWFLIDHLPPGLLLVDHKKHSEANPPVVVDRRVASGYVSLCPVSENTIYRASIVVESNG